MSEEEEVDLAWRGVFEGGEAPRTCRNCARILTRSLSEGGRQIRFCAHAHCTSAGFGYIEYRRGAWLDGIFKDAYQELVRHTLPVETALKKADATCIKTLLGTVINMLEQQEWQDARNVCAHALKLIEGLL